MKPVFSTAPTQDAYDDFLRRTLSKLPCDLARLIYVASMRDYNTGKYQHDGLAASFSPSVACEALEMAHKDIFYRVAKLGLLDLAKQMLIYMQSSHEDKTEVLRAWRRLEPYRVAVPLHANPTVTALFISNVKLALVILPRLPQPNLPCPSAA